MPEMALTRAGVKSATNSAKASKPEVCARRTRIDRAARDQEMGEP
jgi:hypothetical protein